MLDKNQHVETGKRYRFYFRSTPAFGSQRVGIFLDMDSYLGAGEVEENKC